MSLHGFMQELWSSCDRRGGGDSISYVRGVAPLSVEQEWEVRGAFSVRHREPSPSVEQECGRDSEWRSCGLLGAVRSELPLSVDKEPGLFHWRETTGSSQDQRDSSCPPIIGAAPLTLVLSLTCCPPLPFDIPHHELRAHLDPTVPYLQSSTLHVLTSNDEPYHYTTLPTPTSGAQSTRTADMDEFKKWRRALDSQPSAVRNRWPEKVAWGFGKEQCESSRNSSSTVPPHRPSHLEALIHEES